MEENLARQLRFDISQGVGRDECNCLPCWRSKPARVGGRRGRLAKLPNQPHGEHRHHGNPAYQHLEPKGVAHEGSATLHQRSPIQES
jgi:hypothetical protein